MAKAKYIVESVEIDQDNLITFEAQISDENSKETHGNLAISFDLANLLMSDDENVVNEVLGMIRQLVENQVHGQFCDDDSEHGNGRHAVIAEA